MEKLTDEQLNLIVEALLFGACLEVTDNWSPNDRSVMIHTALSLCNKNTPLNNIQIHKMDDDENSNITVQSIISCFPKLNVVSTSADANNPLN